MICRTLTVTSRFEGCENGASVHSRFTSRLPPRVDDEQRLLDEGTTYGSTRAERERLRALGFGDVDIHGLVLPTPRSRIGSCSVRASPEFLGLVPGDKKF